MRRRSNGDDLVQRSYCAHFLVFAADVIKCCLLLILPSWSLDQGCKGAMFLVASTLSGVAMFVLQASVVKKFSAQLSLTTLICFMGTLQSAAVTLALERRPSAWAIGWDMKLLAAVYSGVVGSGIAYYVQGLCMRIKGPVFPTAFSPLEMIVVAIMDSIIFAQRIFLGIVMGGVLIVLGLYGVLWGKAGKDISDSSTPSEMLPIPLPSLPGQGMPGAD